MSSLGSSWQSTAKLNVKGASSGLRLLQDTIRTADWLKCRQVLPAHFGKAMMSSNWGTFQDVQSKYRAMRMNEEEAQAAAQADLQQEPIDGQYFGTPGSSTTKCLAKSGLLGIKVCQMREAGRMDGLT